MTQNVINTASLQEKEVAVVDPEIVRFARYLAERGWGAKRIALELGIARNTVRRYLRLGPLAEAPPVRCGQRKLAAEGVARAAQLLGKEAEGNAVVVTRMLRAEGYVASVRSVQRACQPVRAALRRDAVATMRYDTPPGYQMQIDFGQKRVNIGGELVRVFLFVAVLGHSRRIFVRALLSERQEDWQEGVAAAFAHFGGSTRTLLIDNPKAMVLTPRVGEKPAALHPAFAAFCGDWGVSARACAPYRARTKGKVESGVKYVKRNALAGLPFTTFAALSAHLGAWMQAADARVHGTTGEVPATLFAAAEQEALAPLPQRPLPARMRRLRRKVANDALVDIDGIRYSVPHRLVGELVEVHVGDAQVRVYRGGGCVAEHPRSREPRARVVDMAHYDGLLRRQTQASPPTAAAAESGTAEDLLMGRSLAAYTDVVEGGGR